MLKQILCSLYELIQVESSLTDADRGPQGEGHDFESRVASSLFGLGKQYGSNHNFAALPARYMLREHTYSGNQYQFDAAFIYESVFFGIECKKKEITTNENLYYFGAKIIDYKLGKMKKNIVGIFLSTSEIENAARNYALAYGITAIDPKWPPVEYLLSKTPENSPLFHALENLNSNVKRNSIMISAQPAWKEPSAVFGNYRNLLSKWNERIGQ